MVIGIILFMIAAYAIGSLLTVVFTNAAAIYTILAIVIFMALTLTIMERTRRLGWTGFIIAVILYVSIDVLAPYRNVLVLAISGILTIWGLILVKRPMLRFVRNNPTLPVWARWLLRLI